MSGVLLPMLAGVPILVILILMLGMRWSAARAGGLGLVATLLLAWFVFGYGSDTLPELGRVPATLGGLGEAVFIAFTILWIIFPALCIYELQVSTGAIDVLRMAMGRLSRDPRIIALLVAWFFALFMEGAAGFGTSVALAAPFLVSAGFSRVQAVIAAMIGHAVGVSFGAVGTPILPQIAVTPFTGLELSSAAGLYHSLLGWLMPLLLMWLITRSLPPEARQGWAIWGWTLLAAAAFLLPYFLLSRYLGPELPTLGGSLLGGLVFIAALLVARRGRSTVESAAKPVGEWKAAAPYLVLVLLVLVTRLLPELRSLLMNSAISWKYAVFGGDMAPFYHPGTLLLLSFGLGALWQGAGGKLVGQAMWRAAARLTPVTLALLAMLGMSRLMVHSA